MTFKPLICITITFSVRCTVISKFVPLLTVSAGKIFFSNFGPGKQPSLHPFWVATVTGPVVCIVAVAHTLLWRQLSGIVGSIVSILVHKIKKISTIIFIESLLHIYKTWYLWNIINKKHV